MMGYANEKLNLRILKEKKNCMYKCILRHLTESILPDIVRTYEHSKFYVDSLRKKYILFVINPRRFVCYSSLHTRFSIVTQSFLRVFVSFFFSCPLSSSALGLPPATWPSTHLLRLFSLAGFFSTSV